VSKHHQLLYEAEQKQISSIIVGVVLREQNINVVPCEDCAT